MSPEHITKQVNVIMDRITAAYTAVDGLRYCIADAARSAPENDCLQVALSDIDSDLRLIKLRSDLAGLYDIIERARDNLLPEHFERLAPKPKIRTTYVHPPIPIRTMDWCACVEGTEEDGPYGWGPTEQDATDALMEALNDHASN